MKSIVKKFVFLFFLIACNNHAKINEQEERIQTNHIEEYFSDDTGPSVEDLPKLRMEIDAATRLNIFRIILKDVKIRKLYDFSRLEKDKLLDVYRNFQITFNSYNDSSDKPLIDFFDTLFQKIELHEEKISDNLTTDVRIRLEIAKIKSDIKTSFALKKSEEFRK